MTAEDVASLVEKGRRSLKAAERLAKDEDYDFAASRAYYAMFYLAEVLLLNRGFRSSKRAGILTGLYEHFVKPGNLSKEHHQALHHAFESRQVGDYGFREKFPEEEAERLIQEARSFIKAAEVLLKG